jgi:signal transduction histidine kinase/DNA-binding response OmpR family regulator
MLQGQDDLTVVSSMILSELATLVSAQHGVFYTIASRSDDTAEAVLEMQAGYGYEERKRLSTSFRLGEGLVGQCAKEKKRILLTDVPSDYVRINSGLGNAVPLNIIVLPVMFEGSLLAVIELASFSLFSVTHQAFLDSITESVGIVLNTIHAAGLTESLLRQSQSQAETLRSQQEELRSSNEDLASQARLLADQNLVAEQKNLEVEESKRLIEEKVSQLAVSSKYKSEFIANMSHELRTPLNSLLILAQQLQDNPDNNMTQTQVEYASVIHSSGNDLLQLLNSILDLAKVESGTVTAERVEVSLRELRIGLLREFEPVARRKALEYVVEVDADCPENITTDPQRLRQILKNLLANAFKFTDRGRVALRIKVVQDGWNGQLEGLDKSSSVVAMSVSDTGIGIDAEQQQRIFEAFAQGDGSTSRLYGGTGLGLSISRELVVLLGGEIRVESLPGQGSTFTLFIPVDAPRSGPAVTEADHSMANLRPSLPVADQRSRNQKSSGTPRELVDDSVLLPRGQADQTIEGVRILVVDDDPRNRFAMMALLDGAGADVTVVESGSAALEALTQAEDSVDVVLMDIMMPLLDGYDTMRAIRSMEGLRLLPVIAVTGKVMAGERKRCMDAGASDYVPKPVDATELMAALRPWLPQCAKHASTVADVDEPVSVVADAKLSLATKSVEETTFEGLTFLVVDDDFRNIFAMRALLERESGAVVAAESGADAIALLERKTDIDIILMDIMMPGMDGYDTIRAIRAMEESRVLPIIAVTGKVMAGERKRCMDAGATDYVPKPVDTSELIAALRPWLPTVDRPAA